MQRRRCTRLDTTGWAKWSTGICGRNLNFTIQINGYMHNPASVLENWHTWTPMGHWHINGSPNLSQKTRPYNNQQKKKKKRKKITCKIMDFAVAADHKKTESEKEDKCLDLASELKNCGTWNWQLCQSWLVLLVQSPKNY